ncbi:hypothetical protein PABG_12407 [Paracoccidioides brasiliensis Pb03]|nr:hypothetical protein PABG_12407 [Paracoccidioides brasiliensis Pb03]
MWKRSQWRFPSGTPKENVMYLLTQRQQKPAECGRIAKGRVELSLSPPPQADARSPEQPDTTDMTQLTRPWIGASGFWNVHLGLWQ